MTESEIIREIDSYIRNNGDECPDWYIGVTSDPEERLFDGHRVDRNTVPWIYRRCLSSRAARNVEDYYLGERGAMGAPGGGDDNTVFVYAYKITDGVTIESV